MELDPSGWFELIADLNHQSGNGLVWTWTWTRSDGPEPWPMLLVSRPADRRSRVEGSMEQQVWEVAQLHQIIDRMARMLIAHMACQAIQWLSMKE